MKILHISGAKAWGGNEQQLIYCIPELNRLGIENIVLGINDTVLKKRCLASSIHFIPWRNKKLLKFSNFSFFKELIKKTKPDIIHLHTTNSLTFYVLISFFLSSNAKIIFSKKAISASSSFLSRLKYNSKKIDAIFCVSKAVESNFSEILSDDNKKKLIVLHDSVPVTILNKKGKVDLREQYNVAKDNFLVGNIANHTTAKDLNTFINTADYLINVLDRKEVSFFQIGEYSKLTDQYLKLIEEKNLQKYVIFTDAIEDASSLNSQFDIFLMTSQREGGPTSVLEAMLVGIPVVATNVGIIPEVITDAVNAFVSPIKNFENLAYKINLLLDDKNLQKEFVEKSREIIEEGFIASVIAKKTYETYKRIINS